MKRADFGAAPGPRDVTEKNASTSLNKPPGPPTAARQRNVFIFLCCMMAMVNYDSGAIPAALDNIEKEFTLNSLQLGLLGCLPYVALTVMSPISGAILTRYSP